VGLANTNYTNINLISFDLFMIYWHFVDVVWVFLYILIYCGFLLELIISCLTRRGFYIFKRRKGLLNLKTLVCAF
jgi:hypothetical protein